MLCCGLFYNVVAKVEFTGQNSKNLSASIEPLSVSRFVLDWLVSALIPRYCSLVRQSAH